MSRKRENQYQPDVVSPPGDTLIDILESKDMTQVDLADRLGRSRKHVNEVIKGVAALTPEMALQLERVLGAPARFWNNREQQYRDHLARQDERKRLEAELEWLKEFPVKEMCQRGWVAEAIDPVNQVRELLGFFGVASPERWTAKWLAPDAAFRQSAAFGADPYAVAAWLRQGDIEAQKLECMPYSKAGFRAALDRIRILTQEPPKVCCAEAVRICAQTGVAVVFVPSLPRTRASGATRWLSPRKALIQLSLRYRSDDQLWFSFFHEAGHILLHGKRDVFVDADGENDTEEEEQANRFASDHLIPPGEWRSFAHRGYHYSHGDIQHFAQQLQIAPGIVVGRLQHEDYLSHGFCNDLKRQLSWAMDSSVIIKT